MNIAVLKICFKYGGIFGSIPIFKFKGNNCEIVMKLTCLSQAILLVLLVFRIIEDTALLGKFFGNTSGKTDYSEACYLFKLVFFYLVILFNTSNIFLKKQKWNQVLTELIDISYFLMTKLNEKPAFKIRWILVPVVIVAIVTAVNIPDFMTVIYMDYLIISQIIIVTVCLFMKKIYKDMTTYLKISTSRNRNTVLFQLEVNCFAKLCRSMTSVIDLFSNLFGWVLISLIGILVSSFLNLIFQFVSGGTNDPMEKFDAFVNSVIMLVTFMLSI